MIDPKFGNTNGGILKLTPNPKNPMKTILAVLSLLSVFTVSIPNVQAQSLDSDVLAIAYKICNLELKYARSGLATEEGISQIVLTAQVALKTYLTEEKRYSAFQAEKMVTLLTRRTNQSIMKYNSCEGLLN